MLRQHGERDNHDGEGQGHGDGQGHKNRGCNHDVPPLVDNLKWNSNEVILDYGCGVGQNIVEFILPIVKKNGSQIFGADCASVAIERAKEKYPEIADIFHVGDIMDPQNWPLKDQRFDKVIAVHSLQYIEDFGQFFKIINPQLKPGGQIGAAFPFTPLVDICTILAKYPKYGDQMKAVLPQLASWSTDKKSNDTVEWIRKLITENNFSISFFELLDVSHTFKNMDEWIEKLDGLLGSVTSKMTQDERMEFNEYFAKEVYNLLQVPVGTSPLKLPRQALRFVIDKL